LSREAVEQEITRIVRDELFLGSERPIAFDAALGELGVGLDSLALVNLLSAVEDVFAVDLPDDIWTARGPLSLDDLVDIVVTTPTDAARSSPADRTSPLLHGRMERLEFALGRRGLAGRAAWAAVRFAAPAKRFLFSRTRHILLERPLEDATSFAPPPGIDLRPFRPGDEGGIAGLWAPVHARRSRLVVERALRRGAIALVAVDGSRVMAIDLVSATGDDEVDIVRPDACYGFFLTEARDARGRGIGLALVAFSFQVARERGFRVQLTHVWEGNTTMLAAATQLLGFRTIGIARRLRVAGLTQWSWQVGGKRRRGTRLLL
jgi:acyl carrier protein/GNAT superfamily N-acetyltransferase